MTDRGLSSKEWTELTYPTAKGQVKAALILAHGAGYDQGMAEALKIIRSELVRIGIPSWEISRVMEGDAYLWKRLQITFQKTEEWRREGGFTGSAEAR